MRKIMIIVAFMATFLNANQPVCTANEYAKKVCQVVYINGQRTEMCKWICIPLSEAGR